MFTKTIPVPVYLQGDVECIRVTEHGGERPLSINVCLNGLPGVVFQHYEGRSPIENIITRSGAATDIPTLFAYGQMTQPGVMNHRPVPFTTTQIVFKPHALQTLFGVHAGMLTNRVVELAEFGAGNLDLRLMETSNERERIALLLDFLTAKKLQAKAQDDLVRASLDMIEQQAGATSVKFVRDCLNISERQFEKRFRQAVGLTPQFYIRVRRFNAAIRLIQNGKARHLTDVAYRLNFYDQSHFIRDVKAFSGITPGRLIQKVDEFHPEQKVVAYVET